MKTKKILKEQMDIDEWIKRLDMNVDMYEYGNRFILRIMNGIQIELPIKNHSFTKTSKIERLFEKYKKKARITAKAYAQFLNAIAIECKNEIDKL